MSHPHVRPARLLPGLVLAASLALLGTALARLIGVSLLGYARSPVSPVLLAVLLGLTMRNTVGVPPMCDPGLRLCLRQILKISVALLGLRLSLSAAGATSLAALPVVLACIVAAIVVVTALTRVLGLPRRLGTLIAVGTSICGITAIVAAAPLIDAEEDETSYAIGTIALFGMAALLVHPFIAHLLFSDAREAGIFLGTAIHDTAQVAGAGLAYAQQFGLPVALETATVTKLLRNLCMVAVIPLLGLMYQRGAAPGRGADPAGGAAGYARPPLVPLFIVGFLAITALRTVGDIGDRPFGLFDPSAWEAAVALGARASELGLLLAMAAVGLGTNLRRMSALGLRPLGVGMAAAVTVGVVSFLTIRL